MHIPDGFLSTPVWLTMDVLSVGAIALATSKAKREIDQDKIPLLGTMAAFVFAAQMLNFPVLAGTSGHLLGAFLIARLIGPWSAILAMTAIFIIQGLIFQDGGLLALGANVFNMGIIGCLLGYGIYKGLVTISQKLENFAVFLGGWSSVFLASFAVVIQLTISGTVPFKESFISMSGIHALIGVFEGLISLAVVRYVERLIPSLKLKEVKS